MGPDGTLDFLVPHFSPQQLEVLRPGAVLLRSLFIIDGLALLGLAFVVGRFLADDQDHVAMWTGRQSRSPAFLERHFTVIVAALLLLGIGLRLIGLNTDLWMDEVFTLVSSVRPGYGEIFGYYSSDNQHTLYSLLAKLSIDLFGEHAWSLRVPAFLFGVASIWAVARIGRLAFGVREALLAALLCAVSYHHIWFSQNARGYTILLFVALISTDCLLRGLKTGQWRYWLGYATAIALGAFAHLTAVFLAVAHALVVLTLLVRDRRLSGGRWKPVAAIGLSGWFTLHFYALTLPQMIRYFGNESESASRISVNWQDPSWLIAEALQQVGINASTWWPALVGAFLLACWIGYLFVRTDWIFSFSAFLPAVLLSLILIALSRNLWPRMFFSQIGFVALFLVTTLVAAGDYIRDRWSVQSAVQSFGLTVLPSILLCAVSATMLPYLYKYPKQDYQSARDYVQQSAASTDTILGLHVAGRVYEMYYAPDWPVVNTAEQLLQRRSDSGFTWVLYTLPGFIKSARPELTAVLENDFEIVKVFPGTLNDGEIIVTRSKQKRMEQ